MDQQNRTEAPSSPPVTLSTGRVVLHRREAAGHQTAYFEDGSAMTHAEWAEYCETIKQAVRS